MSEPPTSQHLTRTERRAQHRAERKLDPPSHRFTGWAWFALGVVILGVSVAVWATSGEPNEPRPDPLAIASDEWVDGPGTARATLIEYLDFECEACGGYYPVVRQLREEFKEDLRVVYRYNPLPGHRNGMPAALAVQAAGLQEKYFEMHSALFENQRSWGERAQSDPSIFEPYAERISLDMGRFKTDAKSQAVRDRVERDLASGRRLGVSGTPTFFLNGEKLQNPRSFEDFKTLVQAAILKAPKPDAPKLGEKVHEHADFKVVLEGKRFDFTPARFQSSPDNPLDPDAHLHDGNGDVTHKHRRGITLSYFFQTLGMAFDDRCFKTNATTQFCNAGGKTLKLFVNGLSSDRFGNYEFADLDRILISYGSEDSTGIQEQLETVTDDACLYSEKCPERGPAPTEECVGGLGTDC